MKRFILIPLILIFFAVIYIYGNAQETYEIVKTIEPVEPTKVMMKEPSATYTLEDIAMHASVTDCWTAVDGKVYDLTPYMEDHPPGVESIARMCGIDATEAYNKKHGGEEEPDRLLEELMIGTLAE